MLTWLFALAAVAAAPACPDGNAATAFAGTDVAADSADVDVDIEDGGFARVTLHLHCTNPGAGPMTGLAWVKGPADMPPVVARHAQMRGCPPRTCTATTWPPLPSASSFTP